jgi:hypothetical protein
MEHVGRMGAVLSPGFAVLPQAYKGKLYDEKVYGFFKEIMKKLSSFMKAEIKQEAEDLKVRLQCCAAQLPRRDDSH